MHTEKNDKKNICKLDIKLRYCKNNLQRGKKKFSNNKVKGKKTKKKI